MRLTVFGATGLVGKNVFKHALAQAHHVTAFGRNVESLVDADLSNDHLVAIKGSVFDAENVYNAVKESDAVISVIGGGVDGVDKTRSLGMKTIITQMERAGIKRIVALGGLGILDAPDGGFLVDKPGYPQQFLAVGREHLQAYLYLKDSGLDWTMVGAPNIIDEGNTVRYITAIDQPTSPNAGKINAGNLALFMVSEVVTNQYIKHRVGISNAPEIQ